MHCRYQRIGEDHLIMYRSIDSENIIRFASADLNNQPVDIQKSEVVEYKKGTLQGSRGTVKITVNGPVQSRKISHQSIDDDSVTYDESFGSNELSGTGKYSLKLEKCMKMASVARRSVNNPELTESKLYATFKKGNFLYSSTSRFIQQFSPVTHFNDIPTPKTLCDTINVCIFSEKDDYAEMVQLRKDIPLIKPYLVSVHSNQMDISAGK